MSCSFGWTTDSQSSARKSWVTFMQEISKMCTNNDFILQNTASVLNSRLLSSVSTGGKSMWACVYTASVDVCVFPPKIIAPKISLFCSGCCPIGGTGPQETPLAAWAADREPAQWRGGLVQRCQVCACVCVHEWLYAQSMSMSSTVFQVSGCSRNLSWRAAITHRPPIPQSPSALSLSACCMCFREV